MQTKYVPAAAAVDGQDAHQQQEDGGADNHSQKPLRNLALAVAVPVASAARRALL